MMMMRTPTMILMKTKQYHQLLSYQPNHAWIFVSYYLNVRDLRSIILLSNEYHVQWFSLSCLVKLVPTATVGDIWCNINQKNYV